MLKIMTWFWKQEKTRFEYTAEHVNCWAEQIEKHVTIPHTLACVTNLPKGINSNIEIIPLPKKFANIRTDSWDRGGNPQCYRRLTMFAPNARERFGSDNFVSMDMDVKIFKNIDNLFKDTSDFKIMKSMAADPNKKHFLPYNGSMMLNPWMRPRVYTLFNQEMATKSGRMFLGSDQAWISYCLGYAEKTWGAEDGIYFPLSPEYKKLGENIPNLKMVFYCGGARKKAAAFSEEPLPPVNKKKKRNIPLSSPQLKEREIRRTRRDDLMKTDYNIYTWVYHMDGVKNPIWQKMSKGFEKSAKQNTGGEIIIREKDLRVGNKLRQKHSANHIKIGEWTNQVKQIDKPSVICDADIIFLDDVAEVFEQDFDVAITVKQHKSWLNGGVVFVKPTEAAKKIFELWLQKDTELAANFHRNSYRRAIRRDTKLFGINQPSFSLIYEDAKKIGKIIELPCIEYNLCAPIWKNYSAKTKIVHVKDTLRTDVVEKRRGGKYEFILKDIIEYYE